MKNYRFLKKNIILIKNIKKIYKLYNMFLLPFVFMKVDNIIRLIDRKTTINSIALFLETFFMIFLFFVLVLRLFSIDYKTNFFLELFIFVSILSLVSINLILFLRKEKNHINVFIFYTVIFEYTYFLHSFDIFINSLKNIPQVDDVFFNIVLFFSYIFLSMIFYIGIPLIFFTLILIFFMTIIIILSFFIYALLLIIKFVLIQCSLLGIKWLFILFPPAIYLYNFIV